MNYELVARALRKHVHISQKAVDFFRASGKGQAYSESLLVLEEAQRALNHVESEKHRPIPREKKESR